MQVLIFGLVGVLALIVLFRWAGRGRDRSFKQYEVLQRRFRLDRKLYTSPWGRRIGERCTLSGEYRGYPVSLYSHFQGRGFGRTNWTSLTVEVLFAGELAFDVLFPCAQEVAQFRPVGGDSALFSEGGVEIKANRKIGQEELVTEPVRQKLLSFANRASCGAVRLSKGFLEYREVGRMREDAQRERFQAALLLLGDFADALSIYAARRGGKLDDD